MINELFTLLLAGISAYVLFKIFYYILRVPVYFDDYTTSPWHFEFAADNTQLFLESAITTATTPTTYVNLTDGGTAQWLH